MTTQLSRDVADILARVFRGQRFKLLSEQYYAEHFGNEIIQYEFDDFWMRVAKERGEFSVDLSPKVEILDWYLLPQIFAYLRVAKLEDFASSDFPSIKRELEFLGAHLPEVRAMFDDFAAHKAGLNNVLTSRRGGLVGRVLEMFGL